MASIRKGKEIKFNLKKKKSTLPFKVGDVKFEKISKNGKSAGEKETVVKVSTKKSYDSPLFWTLLGICRIYLAVVQTGYIHPDEFHQSLQVMARARVAHHAGKNLHKNIFQRPEYKRGDFDTAIKQGFLDIDHDMMTNELLKDEMAGTTAICILLRDGVIYCGNVGDSRAIACVRGVAVELSTDHKPSLLSEQRRITAAGGWVELNRVNGNLALSRALGDFVFKRNTQKGPEDQIVTAFPDVTIHEVQDDFEFILLACDGIWDVMTNQEVTEFIRIRLSQGMLPEDICEDLMMRCLAPDCQMGGLGCDNMTVVLVCFVDGQTWWEYQQKCGRRVHVEPSSSEDDSDTMLPI